MAKIADLDNDKRMAVVEELEAKSIELGFGDQYSPPSASSSRRRNTGLKDKVGLCHDCNHLEYAQTEYGNVYAGCRYYEFRLSGRDRIVTCSSYSRRGQMTLQEALGMAHLIEGTGKTRIGF